MRKIFHKDGSALVLTLAVLVLLTAMVVEFAHGVYVNTEGLHNWEASKRLSHLARSGVSIASKILSEALRGSTYTYMGVLEIPPTNPYADEFADDKLSVRLEDENAKFNLNNMLYQNGTINEEEYLAFKRLLSAIELDESIADIVADWLDADRVPRISNSEVGSKNSTLDSIDELLAIPGISRSDYDGLRPYITIYGNGLININSAEMPVLMTLSESMTEELAGRIIGSRSFAPFKSAGELTSVAGFDQLGIILMGRITVKSQAVAIHSEALSADGIVRALDCVLDAAGNIKYWKET